MGSEVEEQDPRTGSGQGFGQCCTNVLKDEAAISHPGLQASRNTGKGNCRRARLIAGSVTGGRKMQLQARCILYTFAISQNSFKKQNSPCGRVDVEVQGATVLSSKGDPPYSSRS